MPQNIHSQNASAYATNDQNRLVGHHAPDSGIIYARPSNEGEQLQNVRCTPSVDMTVPRKSWTEAHYRELDRLAKTNSGEQIKLICGVKRSDTLKAIWADGFSKGLIKNSLQWDCGYETGRRSLSPTLSLMKDGALRISKTRFERLGFNIDAQAKFKVHREGDDKIILTLCNDR